MELCTNYVNADNRQINCLQRNANKYSMTMENKIWDILENVRQGYITVNDGTQQVLDLFAVIKSLPDSDEIRMKARELDEKDFDQWWWETVYKGNVL